MFKYLCVLFIPWMCFAQSEFQIKYGLGISRSAEKSNAEVKLISLANKHDITSIFGGKVEAGLWTDSAGGGRKGSWFGGYAIGVDINPSVFFAQAYIGPAVISTPDSYLGGRFQFMHDASFGLRDDKRRSIGLCYKHISSAGIYNPNIGRDIIMIKLDIPW